MSRIEAKHSDLSKATPSPVDERKLSEEGVMSTAAKWLSNEDARCFEERLARLQWLADNSPEGEYWTFPGGLLAKSLFEEARYCFAYAQFLAAILLGLAYIERTLAALFYGEGRNDLQRASLKVLLEEAYEEGLIGVTEFGDLERIRKGRNIYAHFRRPGHEDSIEARSIRGDEAPYDVIERDATAVIAAALRVVAKDRI